MMKWNQLIEDKQSPKLPTYFSSEFDDKIEEIIWYNQFEDEARTQLKDELDAILNHISNRAIAFSYSDGGREDINRTIFKNILGHNVAYKIITDNNAVSVCIENIEFDVQQFGLRIPPMMEEKRKNLISRIITETINSYLRKNLLLSS